MTPSGGRLDNAPSGTGTLRVGRYRYLVVGVVWLALFVGAFDRTTVSLLIVDPAFLRDMALEGSPERQGLVMTALLIPYALSNIFLSPSADRWGPRRVLTAMSFVWVFAAWLLGSAGTYLALIAGRVVRGLGEGPLFPVANRFVRNWFPPSERGGANAIWNTGQRLGLAIAIPVMTLAISLLGWRSSFFLQAGTILIVLVPAVWLLTGDRAEGVARVGEAERAHISSGLGPVHVDTVRWQDSLRGLLGNRMYWLAVLYHFATLAVYFGLVTWLPKYLKEGRGFDVAGMVLFASLPNILSAITGLGFGFLSDRFVRRAPFCAFSLASASVAVCLAALAPDPILAGLLIVLGFGCWGVGSPAYYAIMQRLVPGRMMATGIGIDNGLSNFGSAIAPAVVGFLIGATGSYLAGLLFLASLGAAGAISAFVLVTKGY